MNFRELRHKLSPWRLRTLFWTLVSKHKAGSIGKDTITSRFCKFTPNTFIGERCIFHGMNIYGNGKVKIGNNVRSARFIRLHTSYHNYNGTMLPYDNTWIHRDITIEDNVWIAEGVTILAGVTIGEGAIIQTASCVTTDIPPNVYCGWTPCESL